MVGCKCVIYQGGELRLGPLAVFRKLNHKWLEGWSDTHTSTCPPCTWTSSCQRCAIRYRRYEYNDSLSERLPVIDNTSTMTTWVKDCQLSTIRVQWQPKWKIASYWRYEYNDDLSKGLPIIDNMSIMTTWVKGCQSLTIWIQSQPEWRIVSHQQYKCENDQYGRWPVWSMICVVDDLWSMTCVVNDLCDWWPVWLPSNSMYPWPQW